MPPLEHTEVLRGGGSADRRTLRSDLPVYDLSYRDEFWPSRPYEDRCDRIALRALLPSHGNRLLDLGAGYGRLSDEYDGYGSVAMIDRSAELLGAAAEKLGGDPRFEFYRSDVEILPFEAGSVDAVIAVRLLHHLPDLRPTFAEVERVLRPGGVVVLEFANRRHVLSVLRFLARQQQWSPTGSHPHEYFPGHFAHNPGRASARAASERTGGRASAGRFDLSSRTANAPYSRGSACRGRDAAPGDARAARAGTLGLHPSRQGRLAPRIVPHPRWTPASSGRAAPRLPPRRALFEPAYSRERERLVG